MHVVTSLRCRYGDLKMPISLHPDTLRGRLSFLKSYLNGPFTDYLKTLIRNGSETGLLLFNLKSPDVPNGSQTGLLLCILRVKVSQMALNRAFYYTLKVIYEGVN